MRLSHSRVECFLKCPYKFKLSYIDDLKTLPSDDPANALILGHALHTGIEKDVESAIEEYYAAYPIITDRHVEEAIKLEYWLPKIKEAIPKGGKHEIPIADGDDFIGFIDYLVPVELSLEEKDDICCECNEEDCPYENSGRCPKGKYTEYYDLYDWKYSNNVKNYLESGQLHEYKYYFEKLNPGKKIRNMYFMFVPKSQLRIKYKNKTNKRDETIREFRKRIYADLNSKELQFVKIDYNTEKVIEFLSNGIHAMNCEEYTKNPTRLCDWCEFKKLCERKDDVDMALPSTQRRTIEGNSYKKIWFYGLPFSGKTYLANQFDTPLMLNTDGNFKQVDAPVLRIMDEVKTEGRITKRKYAWEVFKEAIDDLEKGSEFKTIIVDLLEDVYDACRVKVCVDNGWDHESDDSFKAYDIVRSEFLRTLKRLINLNYNIVLISHEDTSRDIMKKGGDKVTAIKPNLNDKIALKVAGMVDIACRIINDEGKRVIRFKSNEVEFGGGRLSIAQKEIPCDYAALMKVYGDKPKKAESGSKEPEKVETEEVTTTNGSNVCTEDTYFHIAATGNYVMKHEGEAYPEGGQIISKEEFVKGASEIARGKAPVETPERKTRTRKSREVVEEAKEVAEELPFKEESSTTEEVTEAPAEEAVPRRRRRRSEG